jgi:serpin B
MRALRSRLRPLLPGLLIGVIACAEDPAGPPAPLTALPRELTATEARLATASNSFAFDLLRQSAADPRANRVVSPISVSMALGMLMNGADGATLDQMRVALRHTSPASTPPTIAEMNAAYRGLIDLLRGLDPTSTMRVANGIWYREGFAAAPGFLDATRLHFDAAVRAVDFTDGRTLGEINGWVKDATAGRIPTILESIHPDDVMYLINAIYFKGAWQAPFDPKLTRAAAFTGPGGVQQVPMMYRQGQQTIRFGERYATIDLPYGNGAFAMTIVLPNEGVDVQSVVAEMTTERWDGMIGELAATAATVRADLYLPKFTVTQTRELKEDLAALGMRDLFDESRADLTRLATGPDRLFVRFVTHKTFLEVNEAGTEAAAVTGIGVGVTSLPPQFRVDRPFLFAIRERFTGTILFLGKIVSIPS